MAATLALLLGGLPAQADTSSWEPGTVFAAKRTIRSFSAKSAAQCRDTCLEDGRCVAWNFTPTRTRAQRIWNRCALFSRVDGKHPARGRSAALVVSGVKQADSEPSTTEAAPANEATRRNGEGRRASAPAEKIAPTMTPQTMPPGNVAEREPLLQGMREAELAAKETPAPAPGSRVPAAPKQVPIGSESETARLSEPQEAAPPAKAPEQDRTSARSRERAVFPGGRNEKKPGTTPPVERSSRAAQPGEKAVTPTGRVTATTKPANKESASAEPSAPTPSAVSPRRSSWEPGFSLVGTDYTFDKVAAGAGYPASNAESCRDLCLSHAPCGGWNFTGGQFPHTGLRNLCFLFLRKPSRHASIIAGVISGVIEEAR